MVRLFSIVGTMHHPQYNKTFYFFRNGHARLASSLLRRFGYTDVKVLTLETPMSKTAAIKHMRSKSMKAIHSKVFIEPPSRLPARMLWTDPRNMNNPENRKTK